MAEDVDTIYLCWQEISLIYYLDLSINKHLENYRDLFVLGCLTGFRFSDYSDIKPEEGSTINHVSPLAVIKLRSSNMEATGLEPCA